mmetsp:Transcript_42759/g.68788  ORF Transcript_42759/g.68788 Transcript_42759/m.68788 type:complete len:291 (-) Transcript_42759:54-926(-)
MDEPFPAAPFAWLALYASKVWRSTMCAPFARSFPPCRFAASLNAFIFLDFSVARSRASWAKSSASSTTSRYSGSSSRARIASGEKERSGVPSSSPSDSALGDMGSGDMPRGEKSPPPSPPPSPSSSPSDSSPPAPAPPAALPKSAPRRSSSSSAAAPRPPGGGGGTFRGTADACAALHSASTFPTETRALCTTMRFKTAPQYSVSPASGPRSCCSISPSNSSSSRRLRPSSISRTSPSTDECSPCSRTSREISKPRTCARSMSSRNLASVSSASATVSRLCQNVRCFSFL